MIYDALSEMDLVFEWLNRALPGRSMNRQCLAIGNRPSNSVLNGDSIRARIEDGYRPYDLAARLSGENIVGHCAWRAPWPSHLPLRWPNPPRKLPRLGQRGFQSCGAPSR